MLLDTLRIYLKSPKMVVSLPSVDEELRGLTLSSISLVAFTIGAVLVFLRMYVRMRRHIIGWDDYLICMALVCPQLTGFLYHGLAC